MLCSRIRRLPIIAGLLLALAVAAQAETITGRVVAITDGDTLTLLDSERQQHKIRLAGIDSPERGQAFGQAAKRKLSELVSGKTITVEFSKRDRWGRIVGLDALEGRDVNLEMVRSGFAWFFRKYERELDPGRRRSYAAAEDEASAEKRGLWSDPAPVGPWEYRSRGKTSSAR